jgi:iron(III) transport system ATP-binding protein
MADPALGWHSMLDVQNLTKRFTVHGAASVSAIDDVSFTVEQGEFFTLLGPSGCGKTTTLRSVAGLERPQSGKICLRNRTVFDAGERVFVVPNQRNIGMVFQSYAIWPHLTVFNNVAFPLKAAGQRNLKTMREKVEKALHLVGLSGFEDRPATQLSGGQQQRVALARALVKEPDLLLLDEPLSNLDTKLRERMRSELKRLQRDLGITTLYVTHDQMESILLSDRIAVMNGGQILQLGRPDHIYDNPNSQFVADFMGSTNLLSGVIRKDVAAPAIEFVDTDIGPILCSFAVRAVSGSQILISVRPENIKIAAADAAGENNILHGRVKERSYYMGIVEYAVEVRGLELRVRSAADGAEINGNGDVRLKLMPEKCVAIVPG